jgi:branched-chain amino acid transport system ATP-binding protein
VREHLLDVPVVRGDVLAIPGVDRDALVDHQLILVNVRSALEISDTAVVMDLGQKLLEGAARTVLDDPRVQLAYLGAR